MKKIFLTLTLLPFLSLQAGTFSTAALIPGTAGISPNSDVTSCYDSASSEFITIWNTPDTMQPNNDIVYTKYVSGAWTGVVGSLNTSDNVKPGTNIYLVYDANASELLATYHDITTTMYSQTYSGGIWTGPTAINISCVESLYTSYDAANSTIVGTCGTPTATSTQWSGGWDAFSTPIPPGTKNALFDIFSAYNSSTQQVIATWTDATTHIPTYAVYSAGDFLSAAAIPGATAMTGSSVFVCYDAETDQTVATWQGPGNLPYYATYQSNTWSTPTQIPGSSATHSNVFSAYDPTTQELVAVWTDSIDGLPRYSVYESTNFGTWSGIIQEISGTMGVAGNENVFLAYDNHSGHIIATWADESSQPFYAIYSASAPPPPSPVVAPQCINGNQKNNKFATQSEKYNTINWCPSTSTNIVKYNVYRNGILIGSVLSTNPLTFQDHNRATGVEYLYSVTAVNSSNVESAPLTITLP